VKKAAVAAGAAAAALVAAGAGVYVVASDDDGSFELRKLAETSTSITLGWDRQDGDGYRFYKADVAVSRTFDPARVQVRFGKAASYRVEVLHVSSGVSGVWPPPEPPPATTTEPPPTTIPESPDAVLNPGDSFNVAYKAAEPGDLILVKAGAYPAQEILRDPAKDGATERIVFRGEEGAVVAGFRTGRSGGSGNTRGADHFELENLDITGTTTLVLADDVVLRDLGDGNVTPQSSRNNFVIGSSTNVQILGGEFGPWVDGINHVNRCGSNPVCPPAGNILLDGVTLHDFLISDPAPHSECMMIWGNDTVGVTIRNSIFRNCTDFGLLVKAARARDILIEDSFFDVPMPGAVATSECNPGCPRGGNSIRFANSPNGAVPVEPYTGSAIRDNIVNGGIGVDCNCVPREGNAPGVIPDKPPSDGG
jgi:hypothetical protein